MQRFAADLHIHTFLSPCASPSMSPARIVGEAMRLGIEVIAVCDHNRADGVASVLDVASLAVRGPCVIPGIEITTAEEVHVLGYFPAPQQALTVAEALFSDASEPRALSASRFTLSQTVDLIHAHGGLAVAAHVDRGSFSVMSQLGFLPPDVRFDALEISAAGVSAGKAAGFASSGLALVSSSDSHAPDQVGTGITALEAEEASFAELALACAGRDGRRCVIA
jgi:3',5'-nucleoside bisphosphate phosphatase